MKRMLPLLAAVLLAAMPVVATAHDGGHRVLRGVRLYGTVSNLGTSATGATTFTLQTDFGQNVAVTLGTGATVTFRSSGATTTLANGLPVYVRGTYDTTTQTLTATSVQVDDVKRTVRLYGTVSNLAADSTSFTLQEPNGQTLTVNLSSATAVRWFTGTGTPTLANGMPVFVTGLYDPLTGTVAAKSIVVDNRTFHVHLIGTVTNLAADGSSFTLQGRNDETVQVVVNGSTTVRNLTDGSAATLANGQQVLVSGLYANLTQTVTATSIVIDNRPPFAEGRITSIDAAAGTFTMTVREGTVQPTGSTITVATNGSTTFLTRRGTGTFSSLAENRKVLVTGTFDASTQTLTATTVRIER